MKPSLSALAFLLAASSADAQTRPPPAATTPRPATPASSAAPTASPTSTPGTALTAEQVTARVQSFYDATSDFSADFEQISRNSLSGSAGRRNGHVQFRKPGRMRWDYSVPAGDIVASNGTTLWAYEAAAHQAFRSTLQQSQLPSALSFLTGTGRLASDFTVRLLPADVLYPGGYVLELRPVTANPSFDHVWFLVESQHFQVVSTVVFDAQGNTNRFNFQNPRVNLNPAPSVFEWSPPAGTQIIR